MEALAAFSFAGTVLEFSRFGLDLLRDGRELYKSSKGALSANEQIELATGDLRALLEKLRSRRNPQVFPPASIAGEENHEAFEHILYEAEQVAAELLGRLEGLKVRERKDRKWESVRKAVQNMWSKDEVESLTKKLAGFKEAVETHVLFSIMETLDEESLRGSSRFDRLDQRTQLIISSLLESSINAKETKSLSQEVRGQIETLIQLVRRIDTTSTIEHHLIREYVLNEQASYLRIDDIGLKEITARFEMLDVSDLRETALRRKVQHDILETLGYSAMTERYEDIVEAFPETFEWAFKDSTKEQFQWSNFSDWLKEHGGIYWISGKAGSGKSTLMKHIFDDARTYQYLNVWASRGVIDDQRHRKVQLCLATFFFWNSGTPEQKSQSGLLRALLHQVLSSRPELISVVFPEIWARRYTDLIEGLSSSFSQALTLRRLSSAFQKLTQQTLVPLKICFLVDGLDEFHGDHEELAALFKLATKSPSVKICLSSRPWVIFEQIYGGRPSMRLQDLTYYDIEHYVNTKFNRNPAFGRLAADDDQEAALLRQEVIDKAEGVFLWVEIVVKSLLLGIRNQDDVTILRQRLVAMPKKLEDLYLHLFNLIEPVYLVWASKAFQIVRAVRELGSHEFFGPAKRPEGSTPLAISTLFFAISENIEIEIDTPNDTRIVQKVYTTTRTLTRASLPAKCSEVRMHLTARCAGLLEVRQFDQKGPAAPVQFLHRTARDFLYHNDRWDEISGYTKDIPFDPHRSMLKGSVLDVAMMAAEMSTKREIIYNTVTNAMFFSHHTNLYRIPNEFETSILDNLDHIMTSWSSAWKIGRMVKMIHWTDHLLLDNLRLKTDIGFMALATLYGLANYVGEKLAQLGREDAAKVSSMLLHILLPCEPWPRDGSYGSPPPERPEMVSTLLYHGADPNYSRGRPPFQTTAWSSMLWYISNQVSVGRGGDHCGDRFTLSFVRIMKLLLLAGADPYAEQRQLAVPPDAIHTIKTVILPKFLEEGQDLIDEITRQRSIHRRKQSDRTKVSL